MKKLKFKTIGDETFDESIGAYVDVDAFMAAPAGQMAEEPCPPQLLERLRSGDASWDELELVAAMHADDPQARAAVREGAAAASPTELHRYADLLGQIGGENAVAILERALERLLARGERIDQEGRQASLAIAKSLLTLNPDSVDAARCLAAAITERESPMNAIAMELAQECSVRLSQLRTEATQVLQAAIEEVLATEEGDDEVFIVASPILATLAPSKEVLDALYLRWQQLLDRNLSGAAISAWRFPMDAALPLFRDLLARLPSERDLIHQLAVAELLHDLIPGTQLATILRKGLAHESPSIRLQALSVLKNVRADWRRELAAEALTSEPEPRLAHWLKVLVSQADGSKRERDGAAAMEISRTWLDFCLFVLKPDTMASRESRLATRGVQRVDELQGPSDSSLPIVITKGHIEGFFRDDDQFDAMHIGAWGRVVVWTTKRVWTIQRIGAGERLTCVERHPEYLKPAE